MSTPESLAASIARPFEGLKLRPYLCPAGIPTIGYGSTHYDNGVRVTLSDPAITKERADQLLMWELKTVCLPAVKRYCPQVDSVGRLAALMDFVYNLGPGRLASSTLRKRVNAGDWDRVPDELRKWTVGGGRVLPGLVKRREAEIALIQGDVGWASPWSK